MTGGDNLSVRLASSLVLAPLALAAAWIGGTAFVIFWAGAAVIIGWEWIKLVAPARDPTPWRVAGLIYAAIVFIAPVLLRADINNGFAALVFLFAIVWMTDIMGYAVGRVVGGAKLWQAVSPNKTRSGAVGGMAGALAAGIVIAAWLSLAVLPIAILSVILSMVAQAGDLFESALKRRFGAKDTGHLIPGHGGLMDRLDGFIAAALIAAMIGIVHGGFAAAATGLLVW
ncbi:MAG: phosphatidate cytidylyltransferase [Xanthobacteraceae bacterium]|nr:phosphatidate cytidylyltransferase [Xanthobacteraceae bacterium]MBV9234372.1 phosphatidate cytidylyltransferase [Xanthobacteraceae bacterium]MBV9628373.1 phosphatidate cytidylyltransferase [Xanthobacteraceae bacterium]